MKNLFSKFILLLLLCVAGVGQAWGADVEQNTILYFDNTASNWNYAYHNFIIDERCGWHMEHVTNTKLYVHKRTEGTWGGYPSIRLVATSTDWGEGCENTYKGWDNINTYSANCTGTYSGYTFNANNLYYIKPSNGTKLAGLSVGHLGSSYTHLNRTITLKARISKSDGSSPSDINAPVALTASSFNFTAYNACDGTDGASATLSAGSASATFTAGHTANTTLTATNASGYTFVGWYDSDGNRISTSLSCTANPSKELTYYATYQPWIIVGNGSGNWLNGEYWGDGDVLSNIALSSPGKTYYNCPAGIKSFRIIPYKAYDTNHGYNQVESCNVPYVTNEDNNIVFVTNTTANITISFDGTNISVTVTPTDGTSAVKPYLLGDYVMFYFGDTWNDAKKWLNIDESEDYYHATHFTTINSTHRVAVGVAESGRRYKMSNTTDWSGNLMGYNIAQGKIYNAANIDNPTAGPVPSFNTTTPAVSVGTSPSGLSAYAGNSLIDGATQTYTYYYTTDGGDTWTAFDPTNVSSLPVGAYTVRALAYDGHIYTYTATAATLTVYALITLNNQGADSGEEGTTSIDAVYGTAAAKITAPTKIGYTFKGYYTGENGAGTKVINEDGTWNTSVTDYTDGSGNFIAEENSTLHAHWTANNYTVTLDYEETGFGSAGVGVNTSVSATYDAAMPAMGTAPTPLPGYKFEGYWTAAGGTGTKYYNADGSSAKAWDIASATTLYAYFKKTVISSLEHAGSVPAGSEITLDVNPVFNQTGAEGYMAVCWSLWYDNGNPVESGWTVASNPVGGKPDQVRYTLTGLSSGYYKVKAVLKANATSAFDPCNAGTELMYIESDLRIAGNSKVTIQYQDTLGNTIAASGSVEVARGDAVGIKAPNIVGYTFYKWILGDVLDSVCESEAVCGTRHDSIRITASYDGILTATYVKKQMIYFNNALGWDDVYVYFYNDGSGNEYWAEGYGTGANQVQYFNGNQPYFEGEHGHMTQIEGTNIWYFDFKAAGYNTTRTKVAFATKDQSINESTDDNAKIYFHNASVVYRNDFDAAHLPMFVPIDSVKYNYTGNTGSKYYHGYWMNYPDSTGYKLEIYNQVNQAGAELLKEKVFTFNADKRMPMSVTVDLEAGRTYGFKIYRTDNTYYSNGNTMTNGHSGDGTQAVWQFTTDVTNNAGLTTTSAGDYIFTLKYGEDLSHNYNYLVGVHYPEATGDFRVQYKDAVHTNWRTSSVIPEGSERDTVSYFVRTGEGKNPYIRVQKCTATWDGSSTTVNWNNENDGADILPDTISADGVYNFIFTKSNGALVLEKVEPYTGNFYIRVDGAGSTNWDNFRAADHMMPYSDYSIKQTAYPYSHYFCKWYDVGGSTKNIKFVVANDYSVNISDTVTQDGIANTYVDVNGFLNRNANVRFMYNYKTNEATRRYVDGARGAGSDEFLKILLPNATDVSIRNHNNTADSLVSEVKFKDNGDWIYEADIKAKPGTTYKLRSHFGEGVGEVIQWFKGSAESYETLIGGTGSDFMSIRLIYDFKTNRVVSAYLPSGTINDSLKIHADVMFMRDHQGDVEQITFATGKAITDIQNIYCGLRFNKWTLNNKSTEEGHATLNPLLSRYERDIYYVSLPYDVRVSDIIGFGTYGKHWIVEYYDGAARAENGFWADSETYWRYVTPAMKDNFIMKAGTGYIIALDLDELYYIDATHHSSIWDNTDEVELLFPGDVSSISDRSVTYNMPTHYCTINRDTPLGDRRIKDSHWNVLGVPTFKNITGAAAEPEDGGGSGAIRFANTAWIKDTLDNDLKFIYDGNLADNSLTPKAVKGFAFKAMHAYVVQYSGDVTFSTSATSVSPIVARRTYVEQPRDVDFRLELNKSGVMEDQTFISLSNDENASEGFVFGEDMSKEFNKNKANIYTFIGTEQAAGNTLPMREQKTEVPVGVKIAADGDYTFAIPEGTAGVGVTLLDNETGVRTSLSALDYTINLTAGTYNERFVLEISPIVQSPTGIENTEHRTQNTDVRKVLIDGVMYIVKDGVMYDARGVRVQ